MLWYDVVKEGMKSLTKNQVLDLIHLPKRVVAIDCKWIFKTKRESHSNVERYKAKLVTKGFTQIEGIDYHETFSPVSEKDVFRIIVALVAYFNLELHEMNVKIAFLNED